MSKIVQGTTFSLWSESLNLPFVRPIVKQKAMLRVRLFTNPKECHAIVCWKHNWLDCPEWLEVIELSKIVK
jgi:hypothetical protein